MVMFALETRISGLLALLHSPEEMPVGIVQIPEGGLQGRGIHFPEPDHFFLLFQPSHILGASNIVQRFACPFVGIFSERKIVIEHKSAAPEGTGY